MDCETRSLFSVDDSSTKFSMDRDAVAKVTQQCNMYVSLACNRCIRFADSR
jgi:hypothetical protein